MPDPSDDAGDFYDARPELTAMFEGLIAGVVDRRVEDRLRTLSQDVANVLNLDDLVRRLSVNTGRALVAGADPLKVEFPASAPVMVLEGGYIKALHALAFTAPSGAPITLELRKWAGGSTWNTMHASGQPLTIAADTNYVQMNGALLADYYAARGDWLILEVTGVGSSVKGKLVTVIPEYDARINVGRVG